MRTMELLRTTMKERPRKWWKVSELAEKTGLSGAQVRGALKDMLRRGEVERKHENSTNGSVIAFFRHTGKKVVWGGRGRKPVVSQKICRAMFSLGVFSVREVALLTDASVETVRWLIKRLRGEIEPVGRKKNARGKFEKLYRIRHRDQFYKKYVLGVDDDQA